MWGVECGAFGGSLIGWQATSRVPTFYGMRHGRHYKSLYLLTCSFNAHAYRLDTSIHTPLYSDLHAIAYLIQCDLTHSHGCDVTHSHGCMGARSVADTNGTVATVSIMSLATVSALSKLQVDRPR